MTVPVFGQKKNTYVKRDAAYAIIFDESKGKIALILINEADYFLPGGGIEEGENHVMCLKREALEEMGMAIELIHYLGYAQQYFYSCNDAVYYLNEGHFYLCEKKQLVGEPLEKGHVLVWLEPSVASTKVVHAYQAWAIQKALEW